MKSSLTVYKASAGSGKTFTLAVHYMKLLILAEEPGEYARILAVTFTNKATAEMKDRILSQLYGIGHSLPSSEAYFSALREALEKETPANAWGTAAALADEEVRRRCRVALHQILHDYNRFRVQTIDAFFQTILRGLAHELGLTANLQVEISDTEVLSKAVDRIVDRLQDEPQVFEWLYSLVRDRIAGDQRWDVTREVKNFGRAIFNEDYLLRGDQLREVLNDTAFMRTFIREMQEMETTAAETVKALGTEIERAVYDAGCAFTDFSYGNNLRTFVESLKGGDVSVTPSARVEGWAADPVSLVKKSDQRSRPELLDVADHVSAALDNAITKLRRLQHQVNSARLAEAHLKPLCLLDAIDREVADINAETSRFNLAKTPILLSRMVGDSDAPFVFEKIGALLRHVMIDEFQDTSRLQWKNFRVLLFESFAKGGRNLLVGDVKQSIYRWRGGDWRILGDIERETALGVHIEPLDINRRSARHIIDFNNEFFEEAVEAFETVSRDDIVAVGGAFSFKQVYSDVHQHVPPQRPDSGYVSITVLSPEDYKRRQDWEPVVLDDLKARIRDLHAEGMPYEWMTILVRNNSDMEPIIKSFAAEADMPAIVSDEAFLLSASPAVATLIAALRTLDDPQDAVSAFHLRSQVPELPAEGLDVALRELPLYELLETLYRDLRLDRFARQDAYLFGFFDAVLDFLHTESSDIHTFLGYWDERLSRQAIPAGQVEGIRIITIHKAKGLQFHTVFMPFCSWSIDRDRASDLLWCTPTEAPFDRLQLLPITPNATTAPNSAFARDYAESHLLARLDELNALYVAFTRPESNLYAWACGSRDAFQGGRRTIGDLIASVLPTGAEVGEPVLTKKVEEENDNRMTPVFEPLNVAMTSYPLGAAFRQSNRSQQLVASFSDDAEELAGSEEARSQQYIEMGRLLHSVLQQMATRADIPRVLDALEHEGVIARYAADGSYVAVSRADLEGWLARGLQDPLVASWFSGEWTLFNECAILTVEDGLPQTRRPDRVMISPDGRRVVVVDFKFGHSHPSYIRQVRGYMALLARMNPSATVEGYLWFVYSGQVQPVAPAAPLAPVAPLAPAEPSADAEGTAAAVPSTGAACSPAAVPSTGAACSPAAVPSAFAEGPSSPQLTLDF